MTFAEIIILALALAVDAFIVSFSYGLVVSKNRCKTSLKIALSVGLGQFLLPILGWFGAENIYRYIEQIDHWIAFLVFLALGIKIIQDALSSENGHDKLYRELKLKHLILIGLATSIDAFVSGTMLFFTDTAIYDSSAIIGIVAFLSSIIGFNLCYIFKNIPFRLLEITAGIILILLGCKILIEHLWF